MWCDCENVDEDTSMIDVLVLAFDHKSSWIFKEI